MSGLIESATAILGASERNLETISNNVSNVSTPGFKRQISFSDVLTERDRAGEAAHNVRSDFSQGSMTNSGGRLDLALSGTGFFQLRSGTQIFYSRQGHFQIAENGAVVTPQGYVLQQAGGGDLTLERTAVEILQDGTILDNGQPVGRIAVFAPTNESALQPVSGSLFTASDDAMAEAPAVVLRQGMIEASNVTLGEEMIAMMTALREAEGGARLVQLYDDLIGRAITTFGQGGR